jgi:hypothetical protein
VSDWRKSAVLSCSSQRKSVEDSVSVSVCVCVLGVRADGNGRCYGRDVISAAARTGFFTCSPTHTYRRERERAQRARQKRRIVEQCTRTGSAVGGCRSWSRRAHAQPTVVPLLRQSLSTWRSKRARKTKRKKTTAPGRRDAKFKD